MAENRSVDGMNAVAAKHVLRADADGRVIVPHGIDLSGAEFTRVGGNLVIVTADGEILVVEGFFDADSLPDLVADDGARVAGETVAGLADAESAAPTVPENPSGPPRVGAVDAVSGEATALRADGTRVTLREGDPLFEGDVLETGPDGALGIVLLDEAAVSMGADSHLVLDEVDFVPAAGDGSAHLTALQGTFVFSGGLIAGTAEGAMMIETPIARVQVGITRVGVEAAGPDYTRVVLMRRHDDAVGEVSVATGGGTEVIDQIGEFTVVTDYAVAPTPRAPLDDALFDDVFGAVLDFLPRRVDDAVLGERDDGDQLADGTLFDQELGDLEDIERIAEFRTDAGQADETVSERETVAEDPIRVVADSVPLVIGDDTPEKTESDIASLDAILREGDEEDDAPIRETGENVTESDIFAALLAESEPVSDRDDGEPDVPVSGEPELSEAEILAAFGGGSESEDGGADEGADESDLAEAEMVEAEAVADGVGVGELASETANASEPNVPEFEIQPESEIEPKPEPEPEPEFEPVPLEERAPIAPVVAPVTPPELAVVVGLPDAVDSTVQAPIHYYDFDDGSGAEVADRVGDADGTVPLSAGHPAHGVDGAFGRAMQFDGRDDAVSIPHASDMELDSGAVTLWFRAQDVETRQGLVSKDARGYGDGGHFTMILDDGEVKVRLQGEGSDSWVSGGMLSANRWHHVSVNWGAEGMQLFVDGQLVDSNDYAGGLAGNDNPWMLGANAWDSSTAGEDLTDHFRGRIDDFAIFDSSLDADRVGDIFLDGVQATIDAEPTASIAYPLTIAASVADGSDAVVSLTIEGVPEGGALSAGTDVGDGVWVLGASELGDLTLTLGAAAEADFDLIVSATATDIATGENAKAVATVSVPVETPPELGGDGELSVAPGESATITADDLRLTDDEDGADGLTYTLTENVALGTLYRIDADGNRVDLAVGATFTQGDIVAGSLIYEQDLPLSGAVWDPDTPAWGANAAPVLASNLVMPLQAETVTLTFQGESAGYNNSLGWYKVDTEGNPYEPRIVWTGTDERTLDEGTEVTLGGLAPGEGFGLFIIRDGANRFDWLDRYADGPVRFGPDGGLEFVNPGGRIMHAIDPEDVFFTDSSLNPNRADHAVSGVDGAELMIGFEDLPGGGDADFNDVFVSIRYDGVGRSEPESTDGFTFTAEDTSGGAMVDLEPDPGDGYTITGGEATFAIHIEENQ